MTRFTRLLASGGNLIEGRIGRGVMLIQLS
jgi:hypothetical protein